MLDKEKKQVRVEAGITFQELNSFLDNNNLALPNQAAVDNITIGGAISTGVHGTGKTGIISSFIVELDIVTADGQLHTFSAEHNPHEFNAAVVSLGALGVIYAITLQCEDLFWVISQQESARLDYIVKNYALLNSQNDFFSFCYNVETNDVTVYTWNRVSENKSDKSVQKCYAAQAGYTLEDDDQEFVVSEIIIPIDLLPQALNRTIQLMRTYLEQGPIVWPEIVVRFVNNDKNGYLSMAANRASACINISTSKSNNYLDFCKAFEDAMYEFDGRPHWGKINFVNYKKALKTYGQNLSNFINVKQKLDPQETFSNTFITKLLTPNY